MCSERDLPSSSPSSLSSFGSSYVANLFRGLERLAVHPFGGALDGWTRRGREGGFGMKYRSVLYCGMHACYPSPNRLDDAAAAAANLLTVPQVPGAVSHRRARQGKQALNLTIERAESCSPYVPHTPRCTYLRGRVRACVRAFVLACLGESSQPLIAGMATDTFGMGILYEVLSWYIRASRPDYITLQELQIPTRRRRFTHN